MNEKDRANQLADEHLTDHVDKSFTKTYQRMMKQFNGAGCGEKNGVCMCPNCKKETLSDFNKWMDWLDPEGKFPRYIMDNKGQLIQVGLDYWDEDNG